MKKLEVIQMENVQGGDVCDIAAGVGGLGLIGLAMGFTTGGFGLAVIYGCATYAVLFC